MARQPYVIALYDSNVSEGHKLMAINMINGEKISGTFNAAKEVLIDLANLPTEITEGDIIEIKMLSKYVAFTTHTVQLELGGAEISWTSAASPSNLVAVSL